MTGYRTLVFNAYIWVQTVLLFTFSKIANNLHAFRGRNLDCPTDVTWIRNLLQKRFGDLPHIVAVEKSPQTLPGGGLVGLIYKVELKYSTDENKASYPRSLVVKEGKGGFRARLASAFFQNAREAIFYQKLVPKHSILSSCVPHSYHSSGSLLTGEYMIVMEDLTGKAVPANHLLGNQCWGAVPLPEEFQNVQIYEVLRTIFLHMAEIHARFWRDERLLEEEWMRGVRWKTGRGRVSWEAAIDNTRARWRAVSARADSAVFTTRQREAIEALLGRCTWAIWQRHNNVRRSSFTLTHGDLHAGNILWTVQNGKCQAIFLDWSQVGIGCPFTELAQIMISNAPIGFRRENERKLFEEYYKRLMELGVDFNQLPQETCWERYKAGGIERWLQLLILLASAELPDFALRWFSLQVETFLSDHWSAIPECFNTVY